MQKALTLRERKLFVVAALMQYRWVRAVSHDVLFRANTVASGGAAPISEIIETIALDAEIELSDEQVESLVRQVEQDLP